MSRFAQHGCTEHTASGGGRSGAAQRSRGLARRSGAAQRSRGRGGRSRRLRCSRRLATTSACWLLATLALCGSVRAQTALTDANIRTARDACLAVDPVGGICPGTPYGSMPGWDTSAVTDMNSLFYDWLPSEDRRRVHAAEPFDEIEEWHLVCAALPCGM